MWNLKKKVIIIFKCLCWIMCGKIKNNLHPEFFLPSSHTLASLKLLLPGLKPTNKNHLIDHIKINLKTI